MTDSYLFRVLLIPSAVFLSVIFGPSYSSGAAVTQFISINGPTGGLVSIVTIAVVFALLLGLSFELARLFKAYEYVGFIRILLRRGWVLYEIVILAGIVIGLSIAITIGGAIVEDHFGPAIWVGSLSVFILIVVLTYFGQDIVQKSMVLSIITLFVVLTILVFQLVSGGHLDRVMHVLTSVDHQAGGALSGLKYAVVTGGFVPLLLYCGKGLRSRSEVVVAAVVAAVFAVVPEVVFHFLFLVDYPAIIEERIPVYRMIELVSTPLVLNFYVLIMFVLIAQTGVGLLQGLVQRLDAWEEKRKGAPLTPAGHAAVAAATAAVSVALGSMGVIALILRAYAVFFVAFIVVFVVPLLTYGAYLVFRHSSIGESQ